MSNTPWNSARNDFAAFVSQKINDGVMGPLGLIEHWWIDFLFDWLEQRYSLDGEE